MFHKHVDDLPRILFVVPHAFDRPGTGATHRTRSLNEALSGCGNVEVYLAESSTPELPAPGALAGYLQRLKARSSPYLPKRNHADAVAAKIRSGNFDVVVVRYLTTWIAVGMPRANLLIIDFDDDPLQAYDSAASAKGLFGRLRRKLISKIIASQISFASHRAAQIWIANPDDASRGPKYRLVPNAAPPVRERPDIEQQPMRFAFFADMRYQPNIDALNWYLNEVHPTLKAESPEAEVVICGRFPSGGDSTTKTRIPGLRVAGFVPDISGIYHGCAASIAPIISGSGTSVKVMESLAAGVPCIGTRLAYRGYASAAKDALQEIVADDAAEFVSKMLALGRTPENQEALRVECRNFAARYWSQKVVLDSVRAALAETEVFSSKISET